MPRRKDSQRYSRYHMEHNRKQAADSLRPTGTWAVVPFRQHEVGEEGGAKHEGHEDSGEDVVGSGTYERLVVDVSIAIERLVLPCQVDAV